MSEEEAAEPMAVGPGLAIVSGVEGCADTNLLIEGKDAPEDMADYTDGYCATSTMTFGTTLASGAVAGTCFGTADAKVCHGAQAGEEDGQLLG